MLQFIRDRAQSWIAIVIVGMLILALGAFAWDSYFRADPVVAAATVNGEKITAAEFQRSYQNQRARLQNMLGGIDISQIIPDENKYKKDILEQLVKEELIYQSAVDAGYRISDSYLYQYIRTFPAFQSDGKFDKELYKRVLRQNMWSPAEYEDVVRKELTIQQYRNAILGTVSVSNPEQDFLISKQEQQRDIGYLDIPVSAFIEDVSVSDEEASAYYEKNRSQFMTPEQVSVEYLELSVPELVKTIEVDEATLRELYETRKSDFSVPEERRTKHILIEAGSEEEYAEALKRIKELAEEIKSGKSFEDVAKESSDDIGSAGQGGDLGYLDREAMLDEAYADAAFSLKQDEISEPVRTEYGYHLIKLVDVKANKPKSFEEVRNQLEEEYRQLQAEEKFYDLGEILANATFENPDSLEPAAEELGMEIQTSSLFTRDSGVGIAMNPKVREAAFSEDVLGAGNNSEPLELDKEHVVVLRVKTHREASQRPFDTVKDSIIAMLRSDKARAQAREEGESLLNQLRQGADMAVVAKDKGWNLHKPGMVKRSAKEVDGEVIDYVFKMVRPEENKAVYGGFSKQSGDYTVVALFRVEDGDPAAVDQAQREQLVRARERALGIAELIGAMDNLRDKASVKLYPENL